MRCRPVRRGDRSDELPQRKRNRALHAAARVLRTLPSQVLLQPRMGRGAPMSDRSVANFLSAFSPAVAAGPAAGVVYAALTAVAMVIGAMPAVGQQVCRPALAIKDIHFSKMKPPTLERRWTATVSVDASRCAMNTGLLRDRFLPAQGKRGRARIPRAVRMAAARGEGFGGFLGRRSGRGVLAGQRRAAPLSRLRDQERVRALAPPCGVFAHVSVASAGRQISFSPFKLAWPSLPTMMWSCTEMPSGLATSTIACVIWMSARDGVGSPDG